MKRAELIVPEGLRDVLERLAERRGVTFEALYEQAVNDGVRRLLLSEEEWLCSYLGIPRSQPAPKEHEK